MPGSKKFNPDEDLPSLEGKVIFVTGGLLATPHPLLIADIRPRDRGSRDCFDSGVGQT